MEIKLGESPRFSGEQEAIDRMLIDAEKWGYGNFISSLRLAWRKKLMEKGLDEDTAKRASFETMPLHEDIDKLKKQLEKYKSANKNSRADYDRLIMLLDRCRVLMEEHFNADELLLYKDVVKEVEG